MKAEETESNWTRASGKTSAVTLYRAPAGCHIVPGSVPFGDFDSNGYLARAEYANPYALPAGDTDLSHPSFVLGYSIRDDRVGSDVGSYTSVQVITRALQLQLSS